MSAVALQGLDKCGGVALGGLSGPCTRPKGAKKRIIYEETFTFFWDLSASIQKNQEFSTFIHTFQQNTMGFYPKLAAERELKTTLKLSADMDLELNSHIKLQASKDYSMEPQKLKLSAKIDMYREIHTTIPNPRKELAKRALFLLSLKNK